MRRQVRGFDAQEVERRVQSEDVQRRAALKVMAQHCVRGADTQLCALDHGCAILAILATTFARECSQLLPKGWAAVVRTFLLHVRFRTEGNPETGRVDHSEVVGSVTYRDHLIGNGRPPGMNAHRASALSDAQRAPPVACRTGVCILCKF